ncbi:hypothetical protein RB653_001816 [Dictyostelium firmibasis]|uniref:Uncharacterized protein n=1 Tax=Dictyostelium firmibasis TaxID=79012 RepID=A0AAN7TPM9_9MYCE
MKNIDLDEIDRLIEGRVTNINSAYKSEEFKKSVESWKEQRDSLRESLLEFWQDNEEKIKFTGWWKSLSKQYKAAMALTSIEDLKQSLDLYENYAPIASPELFEEELDFLFLNDTPKDFNDPIEEDSFFKPTPTPTLIKLVNNLVESKENDPKIFNGLNRMKLFFSDLDDPSSIVQSMLVVRSCILLGFIVNIIVLFNSELDKPEEDLNKLAI